MSEQNEQAPVQPVFNLEKVYLKDLSLEVPNAPAVFLESEAPEIEMRIATDHNKIEEEFYDCSLTVTVTAKAGERTVFLCEATQAGIFRFSNIPQEDADMLRGVACPNMLYPYVREVISSTTTRAGFPPVLLSPINFEGIYLQAQAEAEQAAQQNAQA